MELGSEGAGFVAPPRATRATRGFAVVAALATLWISAAIGCVAVRRWRRALFWLLADWAWIVVFVVAVVTGHPRLMWAGLVGFIALRVPAAVDAYRIAARARARDEVTWPTLIKTWVVLTVGAIVMARGVIPPLFAEAFKLPSAAMVPTLIIGDHIMVDKLRHAVRRGDVIVLGDNRDNSSDSRVWGYVPLANLKGVARFIWWSSSGPDKGGGVRWDRVDTLIR